MTIDEILEALAYPDHGFPHQAVRAAVAQREAITPHLLQSLERMATDPEWVLFEQEDLLPIFAIHLLAQFRETAACPPLLRVLSLPGELPQQLLGDILTETIPGVLASVWDGDMAPIQTLIENRQANEYARAAGLSALQLLVTVGRLPRETVIAYLTHLFEGGLERTPNYVWDCLVQRAQMLHAVELLPAIRRAFAEELTIPFFNCLEDVERTFARDRKAVLAELVQDHDHLIDDTAAELKKWAVFQPEALSGGPAEPAVKPAKIGRNDPCPCGSGKKYKKCCLNKNQRS